MLGVDYHRAGEPQAFTFLEEPEAIRVDEDSVWVSDRCSDGGSDSITIGTEVIVRILSMS